jgi:hypothetical protein
VASCPGGSCRRPPATGIPLAIELAAAWLGTLTPQQIEASLDDRFTLLVRGPRGAQRRQQTLAGSIDWSHALLSETDRVLFRRLAVFSGSFGLEGVRADCTGGPIATGNVLSATGRLVDKSLVVAEEHDGAACYRMLETIRAYATARLVEAREETILRDRHLAWALALAEVVEAQRVTEPDGWRRTLRLEYANLRAALERALAAQDPERGRELAASLAWFWHHDRRGREGIEYLGRAIDLAPQDRSRLQARLLTGFALVADTAGPLDVEYDAATRALALATEVGDENLRALCLNLAAVGAFYTDFDAAWELGEQAYRAGEAGENPFVLGGSHALQAIILHLRDRHSKAEALVDATVRRHLQLHRGVLSTLLGFQALGALATGEPLRALELAEALDAQAELMASDPDLLERAVDMAHAALAERVEHGLRASMLDSLETLARLGSQINPTAADVRIIAAAQSARESMGLPRGADRQAGYVASIARVRECLGDAFGEAWSDGATLALDDAVAYVRRARGTRGRPSTGWTSITPTELEVIASSPTA